MSEKHPLLLRQLRRVGLNASTLPLDQQAWERFLLHVNNTYVEADQERYTLERSQDISSREMQALYEEAQKLSEEKIELARQAGMAEVASSVLHNVGNVLNSVNTSSGLALEKLEASEIKHLSKLVALLHEKNDSLYTFFNTDPRGKEFLHYLTLLSEQWEKDKKGLTQELKSLSTNIQHIKDIILAQQSLTGTLDVKECLSVHELLDIALNICGDAVKQRNIHFVREYAETPGIFLEKSKTLQIIVNLLRNAQDAFKHSTVINKQIIVRGYITEQKHLIIAVIDNGEGIEPANLDRIFSYGFTTKNNGHGYGLHNSALAAKEMGGSLTASSAGPGQGASFILDIPIG